MVFEAPSTSITEAVWELIADGKALLCPLVPVAQSQKGIRNSFAAAT